MKSRWSAAILAVMATRLCAAQEIKMPASLETLSHVAKETVDVTLDASMLQLASAFLSADDPDQVRVKRMVSKLKGVYVRSFEFDREGQYPASDVEAIRAQVKASGWGRIVGVKSMSEHSEVYAKKDGNAVGGIAVIVAEPKELTIVEIDGPIDPEELRNLGGHLGIPRFDKDKPKPDKENKSER
jgi:hypothetical protein